MPKICHAPDLIFTDFFREEKLSPKNIGVGVVVVVGVVVGVVVIVVVVVGVTSDRSIGTRPGQLSESPKWPIWCRDFGAIPLLPRQRSPHNKLQVEAL